MSLFTIKSKLDKLKMEAYHETDFSENPGYFGSIGGFFRSIATSLRFVLTEKENIVFALLQWATIALVYFIWVQGLSWIPEEVWKNDTENTAANLILLVWSLACVGLAAFPLGILTACMNASCLLRFQNKESTFTDCLRIAFGRAGTIWIFSWIDGWWTVKSIIERLPKKNDRTSRAVKLEREIIYQLWKMISLGFIPALLYGRSFKDACKDSLLLLKKRFVPLIKLRLGYSFMCWIIGIGCYASVIFFFAFMDNSPDEYDIYSWYFYAGFPLIIALLIIMILFRPLYIISACRIYVNYACDEGITPDMPQRTSAFTNILVIFLCLAVIVGITLLFHQQMGIDDLLAIK